MLLGFRDRHLPYTATEIKDALADATEGFDSDLVFAHHPGDFHQDHRFAGELAWQLYRNATIFEYEIPKWDGDLGRPNHYVPADPENAEFKLKALPEVFPSQTVKPWFDDEVLRGLMRLRGMECKSPSRYAEAFHASKVLVQWLQQTHQEPGSRTKEDDQGSHECGDDEVPGLHRRRG